MHKCAYFTTSWSTLLYLGQTDRLKWNLVVVLICISLVREVWNIFIFPVLRTVSIFFAHFSEWLKTETESN